jgi:hypothetical protein
MAGRRRRFILAAFLLLDLTTLCLMTAWVSRGPRPAAAATAAGGTAPVAVPGDGAATSSGRPRRSASAPDRRGGGPKFATCAAADLKGDVWVGSEDQGVWCSANDEWRSFGPAEGLSDVGVSAVACDPAGRVWVGHPDHGVSVYNGREWRSYDRLDGLGASHVFAIGVCPTDGDVWVGTDAGLARYSPKRDAWTNYNRGTGLPVAQVTCLAFDSAGRLFAGTGAEGVVMGNAADGYATWTTVTGPDDLPIVPSGPGLPSSLVNAVLVARDDAVFVGTCHGLARSVDHGATWTYVRGQDWPELAKGRYDGVPDGFTPGPAGPLAEDWVSALAQDAAGVLWVGYREAGFQAFPDLSAPADYAAKGRVMGLATRPDGTCIAATYGNGATECGTTYTAGGAATPPAAPPATPPDAPLPSSAHAADADRLDALRKSVEALPPGKDGIDFLGDDSSTRGDWCGRYGGQMARVLGYHDFKDTPGYRLGLAAGPYRQAAPRIYWVDGQNDVRGPLDPRDGTRVFCEFNDESFDRITHPRAVQGPDSYLSVTVPAGVHRVSLYYLNFDGRRGDQFARDYALLVKRPAGDAGPHAAGGGGNDDRTGRDDLVAAELAPPLVRTRVSQFWWPVYKQFLTRGAGTYWFKVDRNGSSGTKTCGVFVDRLDGPVDFDPAYPRPPAAKDYTGDAGVRGAAARLWAALDAAVGRQGYAALATRARTTAYLAAAASGVDPDTLANWRWRLPLWLADDHQQFDRYAKSIPHGGGGGA